MKINTVKVFSNFTNDKEIGEKMRQPNNTPIQKIHHAHTNFLHILENCLLLHTYDLIYLLLFGEILALNYKTME